jgi:hypothetical protein
MAALTARSTSAALVSGTCAISASVAGLKNRNPLTFLIALHEFTLDKIFVAFHVVLPRYILQM